MKHMILPVKQRGTIRPGYFLKNRQLLFFVCKNYFFRYQNRKFKVTMYYNLKIKIRTCIYPYTERVLWGNTNLVWNFGGYLKTKENYLYISCTNENQYSLRNKILISGISTVLKNLLTKNPPTG